MLEHIAADLISIRSVLKTAGGVLADATVFAGRGAAFPNRRGHCRIDIREDSIHPGREDVVSVKVTFPEETDFPDATHSPDEIFFGVREAFVVDDTGEGTVVTVRDEYESGGVATPVEISEMGPGRGSFIMRFPVRDLDFSEAADEDGKITMGLFIAGVDSAWNTDSVKLIPNNRT